MLSRLNVRAARDGFIRLVGARSAGCGESRVQVECRTGDQNVQPQPEHAHRLALTDFADRRIAALRTRPRTVTAAAAFHLDGLVRADKRGGVFVQADADGERVVGEGGDQPSQAIALTEVLVDDESISESQTRRQPYAA